MRAGSLRHKITIEQENSTNKDSFGAEIVAWEVFKEVYASIEPLRGQELFVSQQTYNKTITRVRIRYTSGITSNMRVNFSGRILNIEEIINIRELDKEIHLMCSEVI